MPDLTPGRLPHRVPASKGRRQHLPGRQKWLRKKPVKRTRPRPVIVELWREPFMPKVEFRRKAEALKELGEEGKLVKTKSLRDRTVTKRYRQLMIDEIHRRYKDRNPEFSRA